MDFETQDYAEQVNRLNELAQVALHAYDIADAELNLMSYTNNAIYRVQHQTGDYVMRLHRAGHKRHEWIQSEREWLAALREQSPLRVPRPVKHLFEGDLRGQDTPMLVDMFEYLSGEASTLTQLSMVQIRAIGAFAAHLHCFDFAPSEDFKRPRLDWEGLFGEDSPYNPGEGERYFTDSQREVIHRVSKRVNEVMTELARNEKEEFGMIHADLLPKNILFGLKDSDKTLAVVDFDDCAWGFYVYDLAPMLWVSRSSENYAEIRAAIWEGYNSVRPLKARHKDDLEAFLIARHVASCRWIAGNTSNPAIRDRVAQIIAERVDEMRAYLETGSLRQKS